MTATMLSKGDLLIWWGLWPYKWPGAWMWLHSPLEKSFNTRKLTFTVHSVCHAVMSSNKQYISIMAACSHYQYMHIQELTLITSVSADPHAGSSVWICYLHRVRLSRTASSKCISSASFGPRQVVIICSF